MYEKALAKNKAEREKTKAKSPTPKAKKKFIFTDVNGKNREYVRLIPYEKALAKNKAEREKRARAKWSNANNKQFMELLAREKNAQRKLANEMNKARPSKNGPLDPAVAYAHNTPHPKFRLAINKYVNSLTNNERNILKKKICQP